MADKREYSRIIVKRTNSPGATPSVPTYSTIENFISTDIFEGELFYNIPDKKLYTRSDDEIVLLTQGGPQITRETLITTTGGTNSIFEIDVPDNSTVTLDVNIQGLDSTFEYAYNSKLFGTFLKTGATLSRISRHGDFIRENSNWATASSGIDVNDTQGIKIVVNGDVGLTFSWSANIEYNVLDGPFGPGV